MRITSLESTVDLIGFDKEIPFIDEYIPKAELDTSSVPDVILEVDQDKKFSLEIDYPWARISSDNDKEIIALAEYLLERSREEKGIYCIHSSSVAKEGKGVVFFGSMPNLGKTTLALSAAEKGFYLISDEKTWFRGKDIIGGIQYINLRKDWQKRYGSGLIEARSRFPVVETAETRLFVYPQIDNGLYELKEWDEKTAFWHLQEEFSRKIRGVSRLIDSRQRLVQSLDTDSLSASRIKYINTLLEYVPCLNIRGTPDEIIKTIEGYL